MPRRIVCNFAYHRYYNSQGERSQSGKMKTTNAVSHAKTTRQTGGQLCTNRMPVAGAAAQRRPMSFKLYGVVW